MGLFFASLRVKTVFVVTIPIERFHIHLLSVHMSVNCYNDSNNPRSWFLCSISERSDSCRSPLRRHTDATLEERHARLAFGRQTRTKTKKKHTQSDPNGRLKVRRRLLARVPSNRRHSAPRGRDLNSNRTPWGGWRRTRVRDGDASSSRKRGVYKKFFRVDRFFPNARASTRAGVRCRRCNAAIARARVAGSWAVTDARRFVYRFTETICKHGDQADRFDGPPPIDAFVPRQPRRRSRSPRNF